MCGFVFFFTCVVLLGCLFGWFGLVCFDFVFVFFCLFLFCFVLFHIVSFCVCFFLFCATVCSFEQLFPFSEHC